MAWTPLLLVFVSLCTGSLSQPLLTQPASLSASPGASARLCCTLSSGYSVGDFSIRWFQQKTGSPPQYLLRFKSDSDKHQDTGSLATSLDPKMPRATQGSCSSLGCSPRTRPTITVLCGMATLMLTRCSRPVRKSNRNILHSPLLVARMKSSSGFIF
ncbi:hypothetical protein CapIbe_014742 [Capra ibex]